MRRTLFTEEHRLFRDAFRHFVEKEVVPYYEQWEKDGIVSREMWLKAGQQGFLGMSVPEEYGGAGIDDFSYSAIQDPVHVNDLNATILHCMGIDHRRFSFKFQGLDQRLTGVEEQHVVKQLLA